MEREQVKQQILDWLSQEQRQQDWEVDVSDRDRHYYFSCLVRLSEKIGCNVCIDKDIERVIVITNATLPTNDIMRYKQSPDKLRLWTDLKMNLVLIGVNIVANPDVENLDSIQLIKTIYFDGWSRDRFMDTILKVTDGLELSELIFANFFQNP